MKSLLILLDKWAATAIKVIRPGHHKSSNVLTDNVHLHYNDASISSQDDDIDWDNEIVVLPKEENDSSGNRSPVKRKHLFKRSKKAGIR